MLLKDTISLDNMSKSSVTKIFARVNGTANIVLKTRLYAPGTTLGSGDSH